MVDEPLGTDHALFNKEDLEDDDDDEEEQETKKP